MKRTIRAYSTLLTLPIAIILSASCNTDSQRNDHKGPSTKNGYQEEYYSNGNLKSRYSGTNKKILNGLGETYFDNGKMEMKGQWKDGKKYGWFTYFNRDGHIEKVIEFIDLKDTTFSRPNQIIKLSPSGDTLLKGQSIFYYYYANGDTIKNGQPYEFKIVLRGHPFPKAHIRFCNFDENYQFVGKEDCNGTEMPNFEVHLLYRRYKLGVNYLRGVIYNYEGKLGSGSSKFAAVYFSKKYYVK